MKEARNGMIAFSIFSGLYNQKKNIYSVVIEFITAVLRDQNNCHEVTPECLVDEIKNKFGFLLPITVVDKSCKAMAKKENTFLRHDKGRKQTYLIDKDKLGGTKDIGDEIKNYTDQYNIFFESLKKYILEKGGNRKINADRLLSELYDYLVNGSCNESEYNLLIN